VPRHTEGHQTYRRTHCQRRIPRYCWYRTVAAGYTDLLRRSVPLPLPPIRSWQSWDSLRRQPMLSDSWVPCNGHNPVRLYHFLRISTEPNEPNSRFSNSKWRCWSIRKWTQPSISTWRRHENTIARSLRSWSSAIPSVSIFSSKTKATTIRKSDDLPGNTRFGHWLSIVNSYHSIEHWMRA